MDRSPGTDVGSYCSAIFGALDATPADINARGVIAALVFSIVRHAPDVDRSGPMWDRVLRPDVDLKVLAGANLLLNTKILGPDVDWSPGARCGPVSWG